MPNKIPSNSLRIFPISHRSPEANCYTDNFITEYNLSSLINRLLLRNYSANGTPTEVTLNGEKVKINGFVISDEIPAAGTQGNFEFNINGYFVSVNMDVLRSSLTSPVTSPQGAAHRKVPHRAVARAAQDGGGFHGVRDRLHRQRRARRARGAVYG